MIKQHITASIVLVLVSLFTFSCIDKIDFEVPKGGTNDIVIQARLIKSDTSYLEIVVDRLFDFSSESLATLALREVTLFDSNGNEMEIKTRLPGSYFVILDESTPIQAEIGTSYMLRIELLDNRVYESTLELLSPSQKPTDLHFSVTQEIVLNDSDNIDTINLVQVSIDTDVDETGGYIWEIFNIYKINDTPIDNNIKQKTCYFRQVADIEDVYVLDQAEIIGSSIERFPLKESTIDFKFTEGIYYEVHQYAVNQGAYAYWSAINQLNNRTGNLFDGPAGLIPTNFVNIDDPSDEVYGYFFASEQQMIREKMPSELIGNPEPFCSPPWPARDMNGDCAWGICCDCLDFPNADTIRPHFWID